MAAGWAENKKKTGGREEEIKENKEEKKFECGFSADGRPSRVCVMPFMFLGC